MSFAQAQIMGPSTLTGHHPRRLLTRTFPRAGAEGASPSIVLAYYPSPAATPKDRRDSFNMSMSTLPRPLISPPGSPASPPAANHGPAIVSAPTSSGSPPTTIPPLPNPLPALSAPPMRKRLTPRKTESEEDVNQQRRMERPEIEKIGTREQVVVSGRRVRCKMCRCVQVPFSQLTRRC